MLSGLKFIPRDQLDDKGKKHEEEESDDSTRERKKSSRKDRNKKKKKRSSSSDDELERIKRKSGKKKKWFDSDEDSFSSYSDKSCSDSDEKKHRSKKKKKQRHGGTSEDNDDHRSLNDKSSMRKELGLEWMLRPTGDVEKKAATTCVHQPVETPVAVNKTNPRELNPYLKDNGSGFPEDSGVTQSKGNSLMSSAVVGDGGASWRLKALKRAQEQAAREGRNLEEVVEERWGSLGQLAVSVSSRVAAPARSHLHASRNRHREKTEGPQTVADDQNERTSEKDVPYRNPKMSAPKADDSISWGKRKNVKVSNEDSKLISSAVSSLNKFANDGSFMHEITRLQNDNSGASVSSSTHKRYEKKAEPELSQLENGSEDGVMDKPELSANQLAAKCLQLRMKGKHEEAEKLMKEAENAKANLGAADDSCRPQSGGNNRRYGNQDLNIRQKKYEENADMHLAHKIIQNKQYNISSQADDEYDYDEGPRRKTRKKGGNDHKSADKSNFTRRIITQQERCQFCFENPTRPRHLIIAIANFTYLMLPQWQPVVPGHCCILPMQHESSTRTVDNDVWDEIRNFKKCLIMMFAEQEKEVVFLETVMGLARQRRHCLVECIPLPREIAKQAPLYFKKAIDEAEDEWSQHNAKKLIDTSEKGLRGSIPKDFPYFHVEFGLNKGFVHVIDDENEFKGSFGLNVIRGMLRLPVEDMHRQRRHESVETQKQAVASFARNWEPFDWTKQLN